MPLLINRRQKGANIKQSKTNLVNKLNNNKMNFCYHAPHTMPVRSTVIGEPKDGIMFFSIARCGNKDCFNRKTGRKIASGRFAANKFIAAEVIEESPIKTFLTTAKELVESAVTSKKVVSVNQQLAAVAF